MSSENVRLYDYFDVDKETVQMLFFKYNPKAQVESLQLIPEGSSTTNYIIGIRNSSKKYLLKIYPENGGNSSLEVSSYMYAKEFVNVPEIHLFDDSRKAYIRPYVIMDFIEGTALNRYVINNKAFPAKIAFEIGNKLASLHSRKYETMALLNANLEIQKVLLPVTTLHEHYLSGAPGAYISAETRNDVLEYVSKNKDMMAKLKSEFVYSHGDFSPGNILIDKYNDIWFIDFEYSLSAPIYYDIGKFFRDRLEMNRYMGKDTYDAFISGYNASAKHPASDDWIKLARLMDMTSLLHLLNYESALKCWATDIEEEIKHTMRVLRNEDLY